MLKTTQAVSRSRKAAADFDVEIAGVGTALPAYILPQAEATEHARALFPHLGRLEALYGKTGVGMRYTCQPREWYYAPHDWVDRTEVFQRHALDLLEEVTLKATQAAGVQLSELGGLLVNTVTGLAIPSLDAKLMNRLDLPNSMERLPMFGLGCAGGVAGIARSARYAQAMPGKSLLFLTVDLCSLCLRADDSSNAMLVSTALFGDGAAGVVLRNTIISGAGPSTSWAGTFKMTVSAWCSAPSCRRYFQPISGRPWRVSLPRRA